MIAPKDVYKVMGALRRHFDYIVVDTPAQLSEIVLAAFDHSTRVLCMVTLDLPSIRNMRVFLSTLEKLRINSQTIGVVLNKVEDDIGIDINDVQEVLDNKIVSDPAVLPRGHEIDQQGKARTGLCGQLRHREEAGRRDAPVPVGRRPRRCRCGSDAAETGDSRGFWRRKKKAATDKVPELETA